jgi:hypothetical protein
LCLIRAKRIRVHLCSSVVSYSSIAAMAVVSRPLRGSAKFPFMSLNS